MISGQLSGKRKQATGNGKPATGNGKPDGSPFPVSRFPLPVACCLFSLLFAASATAAPVIEVRARTRLSIDTVTRTGAGVHVRGTLVDAISGEGISGRYVQV